MTVFLCPSTDVRYAPATTTDLKLNNVSLDSVACGHDIDHPRFDAVVSPLFDAALKRLIRDVVDGPNKTEGRLASTEILIARTRYSISTEAVGQFRLGDGGIRKRKSGRHGQDDSLAREPSRAYRFALLVRSDGELKSGFSMGIRTMRPPRAAPAIQ
jgi:hypothetical protein